jgi:NADH dehydrogenase
MNRPTIVVAGAGFAGLRVVRQLRRAAVDVLLLDRNNYHLFQPLLYQVAGAYLDAGDIAKPVRSIIRGQRNARFRMTELAGVDLEQRSLQTTSGRLGYDLLVIAVGGRTSFHGLDGVQRHGFALKSLQDAVGIRNHILSCFEQAALTAEAAQRRELLTFMVGGGGSAGVEMAGALAELVRLVLIRDYPELPTEEIRIVLAEATGRLLPDLPADLAQTAAEILGRKAVDVRFGCIIEDFDGHKVRLRGGEYLPARTLIWTAGVEAAGATRSIDLPQGRGGRIMVLPTLQAPGHPEVYAIGDAAYWELDGSPGPMVAPAAVQMADTAAANIRRYLAGEALLEFRYKNPGALATIGRNAAVAQVGGFKFKGLTAWILWLAVHLIRLVGFRNRLVVLINWAWDYFFLERASRLILK